MFLVLYQCLQALDFLHLRQVIQRDLKSSNILLEWMALSSWVGILGQAECSWDVGVGCFPVMASSPKVVLLEVPGPCCQLRAAATCRGVWREARCQEWLCFVYVPSRGEGVRI